MNDCFPNETNGNAPALPKNWNGKMYSNLNTNSKPFTACFGGLSQTFVLATALCGGLATAGFAQTENTVTLKYEGG
jgi:hypothetical protein